MLKMGNRRAEGCVEHVVEELGVLCLAHAVEQVGLLDLSPSTARLDLGEAVKDGRLIVGQQLTLMNHTDDPRPRGHGLHGRWGRGAGGGLRLLGRLLGRLIMRLWCLGTRPGLHNQKVYQINTTRWKERSSGLPR